jgi:hypothetical protein
VGRADVRITRDMIEAARRAEYDYYQRLGWLGAGPFVGTPIAVLRAMLEAAVGDGKPTAGDVTKRVVQRAVVAITKGKGAPQPSSALVRARKPRPRF